MAMKSFDLIDAVASRMADEWAHQASARVTVAEDPAHALELLAAGRAGGCAAVAFYLSDEADADEFADDTRLDARIRIGIVQMPGLKLRDGSAAPAVLRVIDGFRAWMSRQVFEGLLDGGLEYNGMTHIPSGAGSALHGYALTYRAVYAYDTEE